ncbi:MAG TPA: hypothetical protein PLZ15_06325 [Melioribacteraceae bacterium]|mgnify:CR=1 FL=1|nr:hypothetical protein [Melioribacteraceae bacterium]
MKRITAALVFLIAIVSCTSKKDLSELLKGETEIEVYPQKELPTVLVENKLAAQLLIFLHNRIDEESILENLSIGKTEFDRLINSLFAEGLIKRKDDGTFIPACMVAGYEDEIAIDKFITKMSADVISLIAQQLPSIKKSFGRIDSFSNLSFEEVAFFILYNVMLAKWQIKNIEERFIRAEPTQRITDRYYLLLRQINSDTTGIDKWAVNRSIEMNGYYFCSFGRMSKENNLFDAGADQLIRDFGMSQSADPLGFKKELLGDLVRFYNGELSTANPSYTAGLNKYGILRNSQLKLQFISSQDNLRLYEMAGIISESLVGYLDKQRPVFVKEYLQSKYKEEINFREWVFWIYNFIAAKAGRNMTDKGIAAVNNDEIFHYLIMK